MVRSAQIEVAAARLALLMDFHVTGFLSRKRRNVMTSAMTGMPMRDSMYATLLGSLRSARAHSTPACEDLPDRTRLLVIGTRLPMSEGVSEEFLLLYGYCLPSSAAMVALQCQRAPKAHQLREQEMFSA